MSIHLTKGLPRLVLAGSVALAMTGCTRYISHGIDEHGNPSEVVFPDINKAVFTDGSFPNRDNLHNMGRGLTKDQIYNLLGVPHYQEGTFRVREWDYVFNFRVNNEIKRCQYKIIYDKDMRAQNFYWKPTACAEWANLPEPVAAPLPIVVAAPPVVIAPVREKLYTLQGDALFAFNKYGINDLLPGGRAELERVAQELKTADWVKNIDIQAYTDLLGSDVYNLALSQNRANTVRQFFIERGIDAARMRAIGLGKEPQVKACDMNMPRSQLTVCLAPNRRVEIRAVAARSIVGENVTAPAK